MGASLERPVQKAIGVDRLSVDGARLSPRWFHRLSIIQSDTLDA